MSAMLALRAPLAASRAARKASCTARSCGQFETMSHRIAREEREVYISTFSVQIGKFLGSLDVLDQCTNRVIAKTLAQRLERQPYRWRACPRDYPRAVMGKAYRLGLPGRAKAFPGNVPASSPHQKAPRRAAHRMQTVRKSSVIPLWLYTHS